MAIASIAMSFVSTHVSIPQMLHRHTNRCISNIICLQAYTCMCVCVCVYLHFRSPAFNSSLIPFWHDTSLPLCFTQPFQFFFHISLHNDARHCILLGAQATPPLNVHNFHALAPSNVCFVAFIVVVAFTFQQYLFCCCCCLFLFLFHFLRFVCSPISLLHSLLLNLISRFSSIFRYFYNHFICVFVFIFFCYCYCCYRWRCTFN